MSCLVDDGGGTLAVPIFHVSSVNGTGLALLHAFLRALPTGMPRANVLPADLAAPALLLSSPAVPLPARRFHVVLLTCADGYEREEEEPLSPVSPAGDSSKSSEAAQDEAPAHFQACFQSSCSGTITVCGVRSWSCKQHDVCHIRLECRHYGLQVDHTFEVRGVGSVVSGTAVNGSISVGHRLLLGPNSDGDFTSVVVSGIQRSQVLTMMPTAHSVSATCSIPPQPAVLYLTTDSL